MTRLFSIDQNRLVETRRKPLDFEATIEGWVVDDLSLIGVDGVIIGQQVETDHGKRIDILALDQDGNLIIVELKRDRSPRDIVAQILDYASWVCRLTTNEVHELAQAKIGRSLSEVYRNKFDKSLPETLNATHQMIVVASEVDEATKRIIEYLSEEHSVGINASFFNVFEQDGKEWLTTEALLEQAEVTDRATRKTRGPWTGYYYVTGGTEEMRPWEDMRQHGFITASGGKWYTDGLSRLSGGDEIFYYQVNNGYLGYGVVKSERQPASEFTLKDGRKLTTVLPKPYLIDNPGDPDRRAYAVGIDWKNTFDRTEAKTFQGIFANQNTACKLYSQETVDFLIDAFGVIK
ncbi:MAG: hypothetical protein GXP04_05895 [Alphaproteobacteria bacterium]|nr:hypothetical protein [Alphaproteobacteria bacterium]